MRWQATWRRSGWMVGPAYPVISGLLIAVGVALSEADAIAWPPDMIPALVIPLVGAVQAAFIFAPADEPPLELLLTAPRPARWLIYERAGWVLLMQTVIGMIATLALNRDGGVWAGVIGWLPPLIALGGLSTYLSVTVGRGTVGLLIALLVYGLFAVGGPLITLAVSAAQVTGEYPLLAHLWPVHLFLPADALGIHAYAVNRAGLLAIGGMLWLGVLRRMTQPEMLLRQQKAGDT